MISLKIKNENSILSLSRLISKKEKKINKVINISASLKLRGGEKYIKIKIKIKINNNNKAGADEDIRNGKSYQSIKISE